MKKVLFLTVIFMMLMSSCVIPVYVPIVDVTSTPTDILLPTATPTLTPEPTFTPTITPTSTNTPSPTTTSVPIFTEEGKQANFYAESFGWEVVTCDEDVKEEDRLHGIFLYREDAEIYFCDFRIDAVEPAPESEGQQNVLVLIIHELSQCKGDVCNFTGVITASFGWGVVYSPFYFPTPSLYSAEEIMLLSRKLFNSIEEMWELTNQHFVFARMWSLTNEELEIISNQERGEPRVRWGD